MVIDEVLGRLLRWPARIIHSIESGPKTLHTLLQITEALINSARWVKVVEGGSAANLWGMLNWNAFPAGHKQIPRNLKRYF